MSLTTITTLGLHFSNELPRNPPDVAMSARIFGATCGPIALAAILGTFTCEVMKFFPHFPERAHTTITDMEYALYWCGASYHRHDAVIPTFGLALLQITGPWSEHSGAARHAYTYTHWIATRGAYLYDVNIGDWLERDEWADYAARTWIKRIPKATGWRPLRSIALAPQPFQFSPFGRVPSRT